MDLRPGCPCERQRGEGGGLQEECFHFEQVFPGLPEPYKQANKHHLTRIQVSIHGPLPLLTQYCLFIVLIREFGSEVHWFKVRPVRARLWLVLTVRGKCKPLAYAADPKT